jgi:hypothetical protein
VDTELVQRAERGDRAAFGLLAADIATRFLAVSRRILRDIDLAEDAPGPSVGLRENTTPARATAPPASAFGSVASPSSD